MMMLVSTVSMRRTALILGLNPKTVARKLEWLSVQLQYKLKCQREEFNRITAIQFDELQTIEHTKCNALICRNGSI